MELSFYWNKEPEGILELSNGICLSNKFNIYFEKGVIKIVEKKTNILEILEFSNISSLMAIIGKNGSGKTTLLNKIRNDFFSNTSNSILIFYSYEEESFKVIDFSDHIKNIETSYRYKKELKDSNLLNDISTIYYNDQINSNIYWLKSLKNHYDISTERKCLESSQDMMGRFLNNSMIYSINDFDTLGHYKKLEKINQLPALAFLKEEKETFKKITLSIPKKITLNFSNLEYEKEQLLKKNANQELGDFKNSFINLLERIFELDKLEGKILKTLMLKEIYLKCEHDLIALSTIRESIEEELQLNKHLNFNFHLSEIGSILTELGEKSQNKSIDVKEKLNPLIRILFYIESLIEFIKEPLPEKRENMFDPNKIWNSMLTWRTKYRHTYSLGSYGYRDGCAKKLVSFITNKNFIHEKDKLSLVINLDKSEKIIKLGELLKSDYLFYSLHHINYDIYLSAGEEKIYSLISRILDLKSLNKNIVLLLDEPTTSYHPEWEQNFITLICDIVENIFKKHRVQIILTSHSPIILSDIQKDSIILLESGKPISLSKKNEDKTFENRNTFGANIYDLYKDAFILRRNSLGVKGNFSSKIIEKVDNFLNCCLNKEKYTGTLNLDKANQIIKIIGEPIIKEILESKLKKIDKEYRTPNLQNSIDIYNHLSLEEKQELINYIVLSNEKRSDN